MTKTILSIESSCDETAAAVLSGDNDKLELLSNVVASQIDLHQKYGGVYPELASRAHAEQILPVIEEALSKAFDKNLPEAMAKIDAIAVTYGPGLIGSLVVGLTAAKTLAYVFNKPIIPINHWEGHLYSVWLEGAQPVFPALFLTVSGGHTNLILMKNHHDYEILGQTVDDAAGEAFDKVARLLDLGYPGGPAISKEVAKFDGTDRSRQKVDTLNFPRPMLNSHDFNFSFSGLKTAVLYKIRAAGALSPQDKIIFAYAFQEAITDTLITKTCQAIEKFNPKSICLTGGVSANKILRQKFQALAENFPELQIHIPPFQFTTDNAAMIAAAGYFHFISGQTQKWYDINVKPTATL